MADEAEKTIDETAGMEVTLSDMPEQATEQEAKTTEEPASSEEVATEEVVEEVAEAKAEVDAVEGVEQKSGDDATANTGKKKKNGTEKRIGELVRQREDGKRENEGLKREIADLKSKKDDKKSEEPKEKDFETHDEYLDAVDVYETESADTSPDKKVEKVSTDSNEAPELSDSQKTASAVLGEKLKDAEKPDDFEAVAFADDVPISGEMLEVIAECEDPAKVLYHLGQNKDLASEISKASSIQQVKAIDGIDKGEAKPPKPVKLTKVADAIDPVKGVDFQGKTLDEMSFAEFEKNQNSKVQSNVGW
jgi:hypothetical protein